MTAPACTSSLEALIERKGWNSPAAIASIDRMERLEGLSATAVLASSAIVVDLALRLGFARRQKEVEIVGIAAFDAFRRCDIGAGDYQALSEAKGRRHAQIRQFGELHRIRWGAPRRPIYDRVASKDRRRGLVRLFESG